MSKAKNRFRKKATQEIQQSFEEALPRIVRHCAVQFRNIKCQSAREELTAEAVGLSWQWWRRLIDRGKDLSRFISAIAGFAVKAARSGRRVCGQDKAKDALSPRAQQLKGFYVGRLPDFSEV